jgi:hypothetical protein
MTKPQPYLPAVIGWIALGMAMATKLADAGERDAYRRILLHRRLLECMGQRMAHKFDARITARGDVVRVTLCGLTATSTLGLHGALRNWLTAAQKKADATTTAAQIGATVQ